MARSTYTPLLDASLPLSLFLDSLSPSCISRGVYVQFAPIGSTLAKRRAILMKSPCSERAGWIPCWNGGLGTLLALPTCPFSPRRTLVPLMWPFLGSPPARFIDFFKGKFYLSSFLANDISAALSGPHSLQQPRGLSRAALVGGVAVFKPLPNICSLQASG